MAINHVNEVRIQGRLVADPTPRGGGKVAAFTVASNRWYYKDGERIEERVFVDVSAFGYEAEFALTQLSKGSMVLVSGSLELNRWTNEQGENRSQIRIKAQSIHHMLQPRRPTLASDDEQETTSIEAEAEVAEVESDDAEQLPTGDKIPF